MKCPTTQLTILSLLIIFSLAFSACAKAVPKPASAAPTGTVLKLVMPNGGHALTMTDLKSLPVTEGMGGMKSSTGKITLPEKYTGVSLKDLITKYNIPFDATMGVTLSAEDSYSMTFSYDQVMNGNFTSYDPALGNELKNHDPLIAILAYAKNGQPLDAKDDGTLRLVIVSPKNNQVVDGHWTVKWVNQMEVKPVGQAWMLHLHGAINQPVDRATFQSCGSPSCHGTSWSDENGQNWVGVPLWLLVGEVDDNNSHEANAYNDAMADAGYTVDIVGSDGYTVTLDSKLIKRNNNITLAYMVNDAELPEQYYPLRLVGTGLDKKQMVGKVEMIQLHLPESATPTTAPTALATPAAPAVTGTLAITGMVDQELALTDADLHNLEVVHITAVQPKNGSHAYDGVRLNLLLDKAGVKAGATTVVFIASDGYAAEVNLSDIRACPDCLLAFTGTTDGYLAVMPGMPSSDWTKNVIEINVK